MTPGRSQGRLVRVETLAEFDELTEHATSLRGWRLQDLDLRERTAMLRRLDPAGALFLGCELTPADEDSLRDRGALLFPDVPEVPFDPYRATLYTPAELYAGLDGGYTRTLDATAYAWSLDEGTADRSGPGALTARLAMSLHDLAIDDALAELVSGARLVGVMGGHAVARGTTGYAEAARLGRALAGAGLVVATGGGPGAMEAATLGARAAALDDTDLTSVLDRLAAVPDFRPSVEAWARLGFEVLKGLPDGPPTLGIPTWFYGHEPPNVFAGAVAKYFRNALREDTLLRACTAGIVFLPGAAGTIQEIFQDGCENYYAEPGARAPMVLVGRQHWTETLPAWPLLLAMARERDFESSVWLVDSVDEVAELLGP
jgi:predicted Rossmann-fold nucleotide-binding protein